MVTNQRCSVLDGFIVLLSTGVTTATVQISIRAAEAGHNHYGPDFMILSGNKGRLLVHYNGGRLLSDESSKAITYMSSVPSDIFDSTPSWRRAVDVVRLPDRTQNEFAVGTVTSGHKYFIERFADFLYGRRDEPPVTWEEGYGVHKLNHEMGKGFNRLISVMERHDSMRRHSGFS